MKTYNYNPNRRRPSNYSFMTPLHFFKERGIKQDSCIDTLLAIFYAIVDNGKADKYNKHYVVISNRENLAKHIKKRSSTCSRYIKYLKDNNWFIVKKKRCDDGAVRNVFYLAPKIEQAMVEFEE